MTDDINKFNIQLGEAMGADHVSIGPNGKVHATWNPKPGFKWPTGKEIDYRDPVICLENVEWVYDNKMRIMKYDDIWEVIKEDGWIYVIAKDENLCKAVALARIEVSDK